MSRPLTPRQQFAEYVVEAMGVFAPVQARSMFGGFGIFRHGLMFALIVDEQLHFKADALSAPDFMALGLQPFSYLKRGKAATLQYYQAPPEVFDEPAQMAVWARKAYDCALRQQKPVRKRPRPS